MSATFPSPAARRHAAGESAIAAQPSRQLVTDGARAWMMVAAATLASAVGLGTVTAHGVLVPALDQLTVGGIAAGAVLVAVSTTLQFGLGPLVGRLIDRVGVVAVMLLAAVAYGVAAISAARAGPSTIGVLAYAAGTGFAGACTLAPLFATVIGWCVRRRAVAVAIVSAGNGLGTVVLSPWLAASIEQNGLPATWAALAVAGSGLLLLCATVLRTPPESGATTAPWQPRLLIADRALRRLYLAAVLGSCGVTATLAYLVSFGESLALRPAQAAGLLGTVGAVGIASRLLVAATPAGSAYRVYRATHLAFAASALAWILAPATPRLLTLFAIMFGFAAGLWAALAPLVVAEAHSRHLVSILGVLYTAPAIGGAGGPLLASLLLRLARPSALGFLLAGCFAAGYGLLRPLVGPASASHPTT